MLKLNKLIAGGRGLAPVLVKRAAQVSLDWAARQLAQVNTVDSQGRAVCAELPPGSMLRAGDVLVAEDGSLVQVLAAPEAVLQVRACASHGSPLDLLRAAHWLGLRQVTVGVALNQLTLAAEPTLAGLLRGQHLIVTEAQAPFEPELGGPAPHAHEHGHGHEHGHDHSAHGHSAHGHADHDHGHHPGHEHGDDHHGRGHGH